MATVKNRMTLDDVLVDLRSRGVSMSKSVLSDLIADGTFAFGTVTRNILPNGKPSLRRNFLIFGKDYVRWVNKNFPTGGFDASEVTDTAWQDSFDDNFLRDGDDIREYAKIKRVPQWEIAYALRIGPSGFSRKLLGPMTKAERAKIKVVIDEIAKRKEVSNHEL